MGTKQRKTKNYMVIGTAHLGFDPQVLQVINTAAKHYNAQVIHCGPLADHHEVGMWRRRHKKLVTMEKAAEQKLKTKKSQIDEKIGLLEDKIDLLIARAENAESDAAFERDKDLIDRAYGYISKLERELEDLESKLEEEREAVRSEISELEEIQWARVSAMIETFGYKTKFVCNEKLCIPSVIGELDNYHDGSLPLSKHLFVTPVPANGDKMSGKPIQPRTFKVLRQKDHSHIIPHMTPHLKPFPRPGLNQAFNYITTGAVQICDHPKRITDAYKSAARTSCVMVSVDTENGEFHADRLRVKTFWGKTNKKQIPHIIHDGLVFDPSGNVHEVKPEDKACHITDLHSPWEHLGVLAAARAYNKFHEPSVFVDGGDTSDMEPVAPFTRHKPLEREGLRLEDSLRCMERYMSAVANSEEFPSIKERIMVDSNHHEWLTEFVKENPSLVGMLDWSTLARTRFAEWNVFIRKAGADKFYKFGDLVIKHGDGENLESAAGIYGNYLGGHWHRRQELGDASFAGPACRLGPKYLKNKATDWQNSVTTITKFKEQTCKHIKCVFHSDSTQKSRFMYRGQIYEVPFHSYPDVDSKKYMTQKY